MVRSEAGVHLLVESSHVARVALGARMSQVATRTLSPSRNGLPDPGSAAARKRAAELELMLDLQRELLIPVPPAPSPTAYGS